MKKEEAEPQEAIAPALLPCDPRPSRIHVVVKITTQEAGKSPTYSRTITFQDAGVLITEEMNSGGRGAQIVIGGEPSADPWTCEVWGLPS
jgi:hypothetical protein